ncbi:unnamed protein product [Dovyalis caffra]|uniref:Glutaredoxin domain-containing protein n=1 Tax=Dovyalis caffra TaxID=77055 RepID=A0AAV1SDK0_9ROSI|nr:unnamed protein product [Dovyalis caffra]
MPTSLTCFFAHARVSTGWIAAALYRIEPHLFVGSKESCKLVGAAPRIAATESHLIPNLSAEGFKEGGIIVSIKSAEVEQMVNSMNTSVNYILLSENMEKVMGLASEKKVVIFSKSTCCLCYAVKILFQEIGVDPLVYEIDQDPESREMEKALTRLGCNAPVPAVFIGGKLMGSTNEIMSLHLSGSLNQMLKSRQTRS